MQSQQTIAGAFTLEGTGIHSGEKGRVTVHPADAGAGRSFRVKNVTFPAHVDYIVDTRRCTTLGMDDIRIMTVEHLLSALAGMQIDNALIEVEGPELPILDGSALPYAEAILQAGIVDQGVAPKILRADPIRLLEGQSGISSENFAEGDSRNGRITVTTVFVEWPEGLAEAVFNGSEQNSGRTVAESYLAQVAAARTFAFASEVEQLIAAGLAKGGSLDNALVITPPYSFSSPLRLPFEWAVHKLLDLIGDLALINARPASAITAVRPGHTINAAFARLLCAQGVLS